MAKIYMLMFMLILAVICLNGPFVFGGDSHPWDEEGGGDGGGLEGVTPDPEPDPLIPAGVGNNTSLPDDGSKFIIFLKFSITASTFM